MCVGGAVEETEGNLKEARFVTVSMCGVIYEGGFVNIHGCAVFDARVSFLFCQFRKYYTTL